MNYRHVYMLIIEHAKSEMEKGLRPKTKLEKSKAFKGMPFEFHHILPKSIFPKWFKRRTNIVALTSREHFFCHQLLVKIYPCWQMWCSLKFFKKHFSSSKDYEKSIIELYKYRNTESFKEIYKNRDLSYITPEYREKLSNSMKLAKSSIDYRNKVSSKSKEVWQRPGMRDLIRNRISESLNTDESKNRRSQIMKLKYEDESYKQRHTESIRSSSERISNTMKNLWEDETFRNEHIWSIHKANKASCEACSKKVKCIETGEIFNSISEARKVMKASHIVDVLFGRRNYSGKLPDGTKLTWEYV